jgi:hypothetical protein
MYLLPCKKCAKHYRLMLKSSIQQWQRTKTADDFVGYIAWMQRTVKRRVQKEEKILSLLTLKRHEPWGAKDANTSLARWAVRRKAQGTHPAVAVKGRERGLEVRDDRRATRNAAARNIATRNAAARNIATRNAAARNTVTRSTATRNTATRSTRSTRNQNVSRLDEWYGAISGVGANPFANLV